MLYKKVLEGDKRALARLIRIVDDRISGYEDEVSNLLDKCGNAHFIGITGSPGAGKSTLTNEIIKHYRKLDKKVAVVAIDPTSPFSHGAILGDRIRMLDHANDEDVFIRSVATRGHLGGLSSSAVEIAMVFDAAGYDIVIIETVGVGQDEVDIAYVADTCLVISVPGLGDDIQAIKAGVLEIGDIFVVNKADKEEAIRTVRDLELMIELSPQKAGWKPPVVKTVATKGEGVEELVLFIQKHREAVKSKHVDRLYYIGKQYLLENIEKKLLTFDKFLEYLQNMRDPYKIIKENILNSIKAGGNNGL